MRILLIATLCTASALGGFLWYGIHVRAPSIPMDHISQLSDDEYQDGMLREQDTVKRRSPRLASALAEKDLKLGDPVFVRIFKESRELEIWIKHRESGKFRHFRTWPIAAMSGDLGPKLAEGDRQAPEGFYSVDRSNMKPDSTFHLAFNIGYPNAYDQAQGRTGSFIMVHGNRVSIGCFAMTDYLVEEIYTLCTTALENGQRYFRVHVFPFQMSEARLSKETGSKWYDFWLNLKEGYDWFEEKKTPPEVSVRGKRYVFE
ncbi:hypothetical protein NT6N_11710 [Oceaniferula spumae]|uniref:L,D-TPase catalytic domain-containing protein n=1 Tax=Oceaniferula spumae TaxID=2979115 RepID=A0AAT9FJK2_9BACT